MPKTIKVKSLTVRKWLTKKRKHSKNNKHKKELKNEFIIIIF